ncbi:hypothetical protein F4677DRAFT_420465 [Hypoxylon crocopeplum]|nr:hypothetical protein F4677DRAFT_420465 [Hypoxylon crocopeplum]
MTHYDRGGEKPVPDLPPPPYSPAPPAQNAPPQQQQQVQIQIQPQTHIQRQFPPAFSMYRDSSFSQRSYTIGEHQASPLYAVSLHSGWSGQPDVVLHNGPTDAHPPLAAAEHTGFSGSSTIVTLPPLGPGSSAPALEKMEPSGGFARPAWTFAVEAGPAGRREAFEWRHSSGAAVRALDGRGAGWKLVRMAVDAPSGIGPGGGRFVPGGAANSSSDGREVVAVWCWASGSVTKKLRFRFLGTGANGLLGERWATMAVITALRIWDRERRARNSSAGAGAGA